MSLKTTTEVESHLGEQLQVSGFHRTGWKRHAPRRAVAATTPVRTEERQESESGVSESPV